MEKWNIDKAEKRLNLAFKNKSEVELLSVLKENSFLFYELCDRKYTIQPFFSEVSIDCRYRCDFVWLNDNSDGPEWVLVEVENPQMEIFTKARKPTSKLNNAIEQVKSWERYFLDYPDAKRRIFGVVAKFKYILVVGSKSDWETEYAMKWRSEFNKANNMKIRSFDVFCRAIKIAREHPEELWSFEKHPKCLKHKDLEEFWKSNEYFNQFWKMFN